jgi:hypothetical protein
MTQCPDTEAAEDPSGDHELRAVIAPLVEGVSHGRVDRIIRESRAGVSKTPAAGYTAAPAADSGHELVRRRAHVVARVVLDITH